MRWRVLALGSMAVNAALIGTAVMLVRHRAGTGTSPSENVAATPTGPLKTNYILRAKLFTWRELESSDYPTYISNLRDIGCPEQTIRDIIIADVNALFSRRRALEVLTPSQQWWRSEADTNVLQVAVAKLRDLDQERKGLLSRLLGSNWESGDLVNLPRPTRQGIVLDGPVLGALPADTKQAVEQVALKAQDRLSAYLEAQKSAGKDPDPAELARMRQETKTELQQILSPQALEEYLLRYSPLASDLRANFAELKYFNATPDEFKAIFDARESVDLQLQALAGANDPASEAQRRTLQDQLINNIKIALGPERFEQYRLLQDPLYRDAVASAEKAGTPDAVRTLYQINLAAAAAQESIRASTDLTPDQKNIELKQLELDQLRANAVATDQPLPPDQSAQQPASTPNKTYVVHPGDNAAVVSLIYGVPLNALRAANPNVDFRKLRPGDSVVIPPAQFPPGPPPPPIPPQ